MTDRVVTPTTLVMNTESADILDANGTSINTASTDVFSISAAGLPPGRLLLKFLVNGTGDTITIAAGDRPPSQRAGLGALTIVMAASDVRYIVVDSSRFLQDDGTIRATCTDDGTTCKAFIIPNLP